MAAHVAIDPVTRIEGHLAVHLDVDGGKVTNARCSGEMFRGFEMILKGRDPLDAQQITQRICGVCPVSHATASVLAQDDAYGLEIPDNGRLLRNLVLGANYIQSHLTHFYHLSALDFIDIAAVASYTGKDPQLLSLKAWVSAELSSKSLFPASPFLPRYEGRYLASVTAVKHYLQALEMRRLAHKMGALFAGKLPHSSTFVPGGITQTVTVKSIAAYTSMLKELLSFIEHAYIPDVLAVAGAFPDYFNIGKGPGNYLTYGVFHENSDRSRFLFSPGVVTGGRWEPFNVSKIREDIRYSLFSSGSGMHPERGETIPQPNKSEAYSWVKAPRYNGYAVEVGPLARMMNEYAGGENNSVKRQIDAMLKTLSLSPSDLESVMGRHAVRALECRIVAERCMEWVSMIRPGEPVYNTYTMPDSASGMGLTEAPRGALGHWISVSGKKIENYQCIVPTTWNCSPRDDGGAPGAVEYALEGVRIKDRDNPVEACRVVRSFDPCLACAVH